MADVVTVLDRASARLANLRQSVLDFREAFGEVDKVLNEFSSDNNFRTPKRNRPTGEPSVNTGLEKSKPKASGNHPYAEFLDTDKEEKVEDAVRAQLQASGSRSGKEIENASTPKRSRTTVKPSEVPGGENSKPKASGSHPYAALLDNDDEENVEDAIRAHLQTSGSRSGKEIEATFRDTSKTWTRETIKQAVGEMEKRREIKRKHRYWNSSISLA
jgi:hypothetical protein